MISFFTIKLALKKNPISSDEGGDSLDESSAPTSAVRLRHLKVPLSPTVQCQCKSDESNPLLKPSIPIQLATSSPRTRRRHVEDDICLRNSFEFANDTASVLSMPSMLSLHSQLESIASRHEEQEVA